MGMGRGVGPKAGTERTGKYAPVTLFGCVRQKKAPVAGRVTGRRRYRSISAIIFAP
jgi:hypothetical protein